MVRAGNPEPRPSPGLRFKGHRGLFRAWTEPLFVASMVTETFQIYVRGSMIEQENDEPRQASAGSDGSAGKL